MEHKNLVRGVFVLLSISISLIILTGYLMVRIISGSLNFPLFGDNTKELTKLEKKETSNYWRAPEIKNIENEEIIAYGKELIQHTAKYLGPKGTVLQITNGMNCQNCHLEAGTKPFGNNYGLVASTYPKYRARSGSIEDIFKRINDCMERSLNGKPLKENSKEMIALKSYIEFVGKDTPKNTNLKGLSMKNNEIKYLERAASPEKGKLVYQKHCQSCHQANGEGVLNENQTEYVYPPLWGKNSYNDAAGLYRISNFAKFVKYNMPLGSSHEYIILSDEEAWDVAAFINSQPRPHKDVPHDWPKISEKPIDHPFGPYVDPFSENQHKYGPFLPIIQYYQTHSKNK
jgi:thiosulfate dehydrogenase